MKAVAAMSLNRVIGRDGAIPWHLPEDFKWFKRLTLGSLIVMGRKTFASLGRPLPKRTHVVFTRDPQRMALDPEFNPIFGEGRGWCPLIDQAGYQLGIENLGEGDVWLVESVPQWLEALKQATLNRELFVIGGAQIYEQLLPECSDLYLSVVKQEVAGDAYFPAFEENFALRETVLSTPDFDVLHYCNRTRG